MKAARQTYGTLELGRFVAASIVVCAHFFGLLAWYGTGPAATLAARVNFPAPIAVEYFFVLSGFVMLRAHRQDFGSLAAMPRFWWRRACRIYPMYWLGFGIMALALQSGFAPGRGLALVALLPVPMAELIGPAWSLRFEMAFYVVFGLCLLPYVGRPLLGLWVAVTAWLWRPPALAGFLLCGATQGLAQGLHRLPVFFGPFELSFCCGLAAGFLPVSGKRAGLACIAAGMAVLAAFGPRYQWGYAYGDPWVVAVIGLGFALVILGCAALERAGALRLGAWARGLGAMSYPLYILHIPLLVLLSVLSHGRWHFGGVTFLGFGAAVLAGLYAICAAAAFLIDRPLQRALHKVRV